MHRQSHTFFRSGAHFVSTEKTNGVPRGAQAELNLPQAELNPDEGGLNPERGIFALQRARFDPERGGSAPSYDLE
jgi:hypothetical protein